MTTINTQSNAAPNTAIALKNDCIYQVASARKGKFTGILVSQDDTWATFEITKGRAEAMLPYNVRQKGEEVTVRRAWCVFAEVS